MKLQDLDFNDLESIEAVLKVITNTVHKAKVQRGTPGNVPRSRKGKLSAEAKAELLSKRERARTGKSK